jgi:hypothetical protein
MARYLFLFFFLRYFLLRSAGNDFTLDYPGIASRTVKLLFGNGFIRTGKPASRISVSLKK